MRDRPARLQAMAYSFTQLTTNHNQQTVRCRVEAGPRRPM